MSEIFDWTPASITHDQFWSKMGIFSYSALTGLTSLVYRGATCSEGIDIRSSQDLQSFSAPRLATVTGSGAIGFSINAALVSVSMPMLTITPNLSFIQNGAIQAVDLPSLAQVNAMSIQQENSLVAVLLPSLTTITQQLAIDDNPLLTHVDLSRLATAGGFSLTINNNAALASLTFPELTRIEGTVLVSGNALSAASVNSILATLVAATTDGVTPWNLAADLSGGTNAAPTAPGLASKATLIARGATITTN